MMREVAVTGVGLVTALGSDPSEVARALAGGRSGVRPFSDERRVLPLPGGAVADVDVRPLLKRRKDRKLLPRAAELAIVAATAALGSDRPPETGLFLGVGREPTDGGATERAVVASLDGEHFSTERFATRGLPMFPPLASLRTLPNLILAHVAIQLGLTGEGGTRAGAEAAGLAAVVAGWRAVAEGRSEVVLAGGADSLVEPALARDHVRQGGAGRPPGEAAGFVRMEPLACALADGRPVLGVVTSGGTGYARCTGPWRAPDEAALGVCGAAAAPVALVLGLMAGGGLLRVCEATGASAELSWRRATLMN